MSEIKKKEEILVENIFRRNLFLGMSALYLPFIAKKLIWCKKNITLMSVRFIEFFIRVWPKISPFQIQLSFNELSALDGVRFSGIPLYIVFSA